MKNLQGILWTTALLTLALLFAGYLFAVLTGPTWGFCSIPMTCWLFADVSKAIVRQIVKAAEACRQ